MSAVENYKKIENEIKAQQKLFEQNKSKSDVSMSCEIHQLKLSNNCRQCKKIKAQTSNEDDKGNDQQERINWLSNQVRGGENAFPFQGDAPWSGLNSMLRQNIINCSYYREMPSRTYNDIISEIERVCNHAEPWAPGGQGIPSPLFCCLYKLMTMQLSANQVRSLINYSTNQYVKICGLLYVRYACEPGQLWSWVKKHILEEQEIFPSLDRQKVVTFGEFIEQLLTDQQYFSTRLPRIPQQHENRIQAMIMIAREKRKRRLINLQLKELFKPGVRIRAISSKDDEWHIAQVLRFEGRAILIKYIEDQLNDEIEQVDLGEIEFMPENNVGNQQFASLVQEKFQDAVEVEVVESKKQKIKSSSSSNSSSSSRKRHKSKKHDKDKKKKKSKQKKERRSRSRSSRQEKQQYKFESNKEKQDRLEQEIRQRQKNRAVAENKSDVSRIPASYKSSLSAALPSASHVKHKDMNPSPKREEKFIKLKSNYQEVEKTTKPVQENEKLTEEQIQFQQELKRKYGDASATSKQKNNYAGDRLNQDYV